MIQQDHKIEHDIEWKKNYYLIERQRHYLARYQLERHYHIEQEERRVKQVFIGGFIVIGLLIFWTWF